MRDIRCGHIHFYKFIYVSYFRPKSGSTLLYSRKKVRYRRDGYCWKKRKDGKTTREDHMKLKVQGIEVSFKLLYSHRSYTLLYVYIVICKYIFISISMISFQCIYGCYVHSAILPTFHRRCYWLLQVYYDYHKQELYMYIFLLEYQYFFSVTIFHCNFRIQMLCWFII